MLWYPYEFLRIYSAFCLLPQVKLNWNFKDFLNSIPSAFIDIVRLIIRV